MLEPFEGLGHGLTGYPGVRDVVFSQSANFLYYVLDLAHAQGSPVAAARTSRSFEREPRGRYDKAAKRALREAAGTLAVR